MKLQLLPKTDELHSLYKKQITELSAQRGDSGFDLFVPEDVIIKGHTKVLIDLQVSCQLKTFDPCVYHWFKNGHFNKYSSYIMMPRSSCGAKTPLIMTNSIGLIDSSYTGTLKIPMFNTGKEDFVVKKGTRLVQLILPQLQIIKNVELKAVGSQFRQTKRNTNGFGSTGV